MTSFPRVGWMGKGYSPRHVDDYFGRMQRILGGGYSREEVRPEDIRSARFPLVRNGYDYRVVDAALDRLELQALERERATSWGEPDLHEDAQLTAELLDQLRAPRGDRFRRGHRWSRGYAIGEVDSFCDRLVATLGGGRGPGLRAVRGVEFHAQLGGYSEGDVDAVLDRIVDLLLRRMIDR